MCTTRKGRWEIFWQVKSPVLQNLKQHFSKYLTMFPFYFQLQITNTWVWSSYNYGIMSCQYHCINMSLSLGYKILPPSKVKKLTSSHIYAGFKPDSSDDRMDREGLYSSVLSCACLLSSILMPFIPVPAEEIITCIISRQNSFLHIVSSYFKILLWKKKTTPTTHKSQRKASPQPC